MPVILSTLEMAIRKIEVQGQPRHKVRTYLKKKKKSAKRVDKVAEVVASCLASARP
jgi:hypothetical protein